MRNKNGYINFKIAGAVGIMVIVLAAIFLYWNYLSKKSETKESIVSSSDFSFQKMDYTIPGVLYGGSYDHRGIFKYSNEDSSSSMIAISQYWEPEKDDSLEITQYVLDLKEQRKWQATGESVRDFFQKTGRYNVEEMNLEINDLKKFINPKIKTPLFFFYPVSIDQPDDIGYYPAAVLIGINDSEKKITFHNYWLGNNYELTFDDFQKGWEKVNSNSRNKYIVIQPKKFQEKIKEVSSRSSSNYAERTATMAKTQEISKNMAFGLGLFSKKRYEESLQYFEKVKNDSNFSQIAPSYFKVFTYSYLADSYLRQDKIDLALDNANLAVGVNSDLDKPAGDWAGHETGNDNDNGKLGLPFKILGSIYNKKGELERARESYKKALEILPSDKQASSELSLVEMKMSAQ